MYSKNTTILTPSFGAETCTFTNLSVGCDRKSEAINEFNLYYNSTHCLPILIFMIRVI